MNTIDKTKELVTQVNLMNQKLLFSGKVNELDPIAIDYIPPLGDGNGYTSLELLLLSLSSCLGSALLTFLRRMNKEIGGLEINAKGLRKEEHPTGFRLITLEIVLTSKNTNLAEIDRVLKLAEETYCPVWAMLRGNVEIKVNPVIISK